VYEARLDGHALPVAVRMLRSQHAAPSRETDAMLAEVRVLRALNERELPGWPDSPAARLDYATRSRQQRTIVALLDDGVDAAGRPIHVQELAPPPFRPVPVTSVAEEQQTLAVFAAVARALLLTHQAGYALKDFDPTGEKTTRIRCVTPLTLPPEVKLIDWNVTGTSLDQPNDLIFFGGHLYQALVGEPAPLYGTLPLPINEAAAGWHRCSLGTQALLRRCLHVEESRRFGNARALCAELEQWLETLGLPSDVVLERANAERSTAQRAILTDLARRQMGEVSETRLVQAWQPPAPPINSEALLVLDPALLALRRGRYDEAERSVARVLASAPPGSALARQAAIYLRQVDTARALERIGMSGDLKLLEAGVSLLLRGDQQGAAALLRPLALRTRDAAATAALEQLLVPPQPAQLVNVPLAETTPVEVPPLVVVPPALHVPDDTSTSTDRTRFQSMLLRVVAPIIVVGVLALYLGGLLVTQLLQTNRQLESLNATVTVLTAAQIALEATTVALAMPTPLPPTTLPQTETSLATTNAAATVTPILVTETRLTLTPILVAELLTQTAISLQLTAERPTAPPTPLLTTPTPVDSETFPRGQIRDREVNVLLYTASSGTTTNGFADSLRGLDLYLCEQVNTRWAVDVPTAPLPCRAPRGWVSITAIELVP
jgi:hypothetical protein